MSSYHNECGQPVRWANRPDDPSRFLPPLEFVGMLIVVDADNIAVEQPTYQTHRCDPVKVRAWQDYQRQMAELQGEPYPTSDAGTLGRQREREHRYELAMDHYCPTCEAVPSTRCINMAVLKRTGEVTNTKDPHTARERLVQG